MVLPNRPDRRNHINTRESPPAERSRISLRAAPSLAFSAAGRSSKNQIHPTAATRLATRDQPLLRATVPEPSFGQKDPLEISALLIKMRWSPVARWTLTCVDGWRVSPPQKNTLLGGFDLSLGRVIFCGSPSSFRPLWEGISIGRHKQTCAEKTGSEDDFGGFVGCF